MKIRKLKEYPYAQAHVEENGDNWYLWSNGVLVAGVERDWIFCNGAFSRATEYHIAAFAWEVSCEYNITLTLQTFLTLYEDNLKMNSATGEVVERV